jgi:putative transposase
MTNYRRNCVPGATCFFTINLLDRRSRLLTEEIALLREAARTIRRTHPFHIDACVILPDHMHWFWTLPEQDDHYATRIRLLKTRFSKAIIPNETLSASRIARKERGIWQRRFREHTIRDDRDYAAHLDYIHFNPVHHGLSASARDWPYSTLRSCVARGLYPSDWAQPRLTPWKPENKSAYNAELPPQRCVTLR